MAVNSRALNGLAPGAQGTSNTGTAGTRAGLQLPFKEIGYRSGESPNEEFEYGVGGTAKRRFLILSSNLFDIHYNPGAMPDDSLAPTEVGAISQILGFTRCGATGGKLSRWLPERHPIYPFLIAKKVKIEYLSSNEVQSYHIYRDWMISNIQGNKINSYPFAVVDVDFEAVNYLLKTDAQIATELERYVSVDPKPNGDYLSLPNGGMKWTTEYAFKTQLPYPTQNGIIIPTMDYVITWYQVPAPCLPIDVMLNTIGKVNNDKIKLDVNENTSGKEFKEQQFLLTGIDLERKIAPYGGWYYDVKYTMKATAALKLTGAAGGTPITHNRFLDFANGVKDFYHISIDGVDYGTAAVPDGKYLFDSINFAPLFGSL